MSSLVVLESPFELAKLPRPLDSVNGQYHVANVWNGPQGSRKRKRSELVVAIDGEGLSLYSVQPPKLITSYALPPTSSFACRPCSWRSKDAISSSSTRCTYAAIAGPAPRIVGFCATTAAKSARASSPAARSELVTLDYKLPGSASPVVHIDVVPSGAVEGDFKAQSDVLVVHRNGEIRCLSGDLTTERWMTLPKDAMGSSTVTTGARASNARVEYAQVTDSITACKGLLKGREDVLATLNPGAPFPSGEHQETPILVLVSRPALNEADRQVHLFAIRSTHRSASLGHGSTLQPLLTAVLPKSSKLPSISLHTDLQASTGILQLTSSGLLYTYDLSGTVPTLASSLQLPSTAPTCFLRLSKALVMTSAAGEVNVWGTRYQSCQATLSVRGKGSSDKKRKLDRTSGQASSRSSLELVSYFPPLGLVVGISAGQLLGLPVSSGADQSAGNKRLKGESLLAAIGRGMSSRQEIGPARSRDGLRCILGDYLLPQSRSQHDEWHEQMVQMDDYADQRDVANFERVFAGAIGIRREAKASKKARRPAVERESEVDEVGGPIPEWQWATEARESKMQNVLDQGKVLYVFKKMFSYSSPDSPLLLHSAVSRDWRRPQKLVLTMFPPNVFRWILDSGLFSTSTIEQALSGSDTDPSRPQKPPPGSIMRALVDFDPEMRVLLSVLLAPSYLQAADVVEAVRLLMWSLGYAENVEVDSVIPLLTDSEDTAMATENGDVSEALWEEAEDAAERDLGLALATLEDGADIRGRALTLSLTKLHSFPSSTIIPAIRSVMSRDETISLIHLLRIELARDGWLSRYLDAPLDLDDDSESDDLSPPDQSITVIADLLNSALDSIGALGWVSAGLDQGSAAAGPDGMAANDTADVITALNAEISATLEGIEEATYLQGLLGEMIRYGKSVPGNRARALGADNLLPLGCKLPEKEQGISRKKIGAGGEVQWRSLRDVGRLKSMRVGEYGFERIDV